MSVSSSCLRSMAYSSKATVGDVLYHYIDFLQNGINPNNGIISEFHVRKLHCLRYEMNVSLWYYLLGLKSDTAMSFADKGLFGLDLVYTSDIPSGDDVLETIYIVHTICDLERDLFLNNASFDHPNTCSMDSKLKYLMSIHPDVFYAKYNFESVIGFTKLFWDIDMYAHKYDDGNGHRHWISECLSPEHYLIWAYMGTNLEVKLSKFKPPVKRPFRQNDNTRFGTEISGINRKTRVNIIQKSEMVSVKPTPIARDPLAPPDGFTGDPYIWQTFVKAHEKINNHKKG